MITQSQQILLDSLLDEFTRINKTSESKHTFNLINIEPLLQKSKEIERNEAIAKADKKAWDRLAEEEADRIAELVKQDLPNVYIGKDSGFPSMLNIAKDEKSSHHIYTRVNIYVGYLTEKVDQTHNDRYWKGVQLYYSLCWMDSAKKYPCIESLIKNSNFLDQVRTKILN